MKQNPLKEQPIPAGLGKILLAHLIPDAKNPRKDLKKGDPEFEKINKSVEKFGQLDPIIFNTRTRKVIGGHQRLKVLDSRDTLNYSPWLSARIRGPLQKRILRNCQRRKRTLQTSR